jgi:ubiquinone/menaquinone biosynthesis C-methylase UbiE
MLRAGGHRPGGRYLELGSGLGYGAPIALERFGADQFVGIDIDEDLVERAKAVYGQRYAQRVQFEVANAVDLPFSNDSFRGVLQYAMLHHVRAWRTVLAETVRVLEPGGVLYFEEFLQGLILARPIKAMFPHPYDTQFSSAELIEAIEDAGLVLIGKPLVIGKLAMAGAARKPE